jgi:hypothetical protein
VNNPNVPVKNQIGLVVIAGAAAIVAVPIFVFCMIRLVWELATSWAAPRAPIIAEKIRQLAAAAETRISGQTDK